MCVSSLAGSEWSATPLGRSELPPVGHVHESQAETTQLLTTSCSPEVLGWHFWGFPLITKVTKASAVQGKRNKILYGTA